MPLVVSQMTGGLYLGETPLQTKRAAITAGTMGDNTLVAAVAGKAIVVVDIVLWIPGAVSIRFESGAGGTALTGVMVFPSNKGFCPGFNPLGYFETAAGSLLNLELSAAVTCTGWMSYVLK